MPSENDRPSISIEPQDEGAVLSIGGSWRLVEHVPRWKDAELDASLRWVKVVPSELHHWDSSLALFLTDGEEWCRRHGLQLDLSALPASLKKRLELISASHDEEETEPPLIEPTPLRAFRSRVQGSTLRILAFAGNTALAAGQAVVRPQDFYWKDFFVELVRAGPRALPVIGLLSFLIGMTFAFQAAMRLQELGAERLVIPLIAVSVTREIGPLMASILLAGRTGAAFAAHLANMKVGGETDALEVLGTNPVTFLVLPRVAALVVIAPLMTLYADFLGILGGLTMAVSVLDIPAMAYLVDTEAVLKLQDVALGLIKSLVFGAVIAFAGCYQGLESERSSAGVGYATTAAVFISILLIITLDTLFAPLFEALGI